MKNRSLLLRILLLAALLLVVSTPADAALRSNLFGRRTRSMLGTGDGTNELFTVTPGSRSLRAHLRSVGAVGYGHTNGARFNTTFARNVPRSIRGRNGSIRFSGVRGGGMRMLVKNLRGQRVGQAITLFPGAGILATRDASGSGTFRFSGFDDFGFTREQLLNDVDAFGQPLARLVEDGFSSFKSFIQKVSDAIMAHPEYFGGVDLDFVTHDVELASGGLLSGFPTGAAQSICTSPIDLVVLFDPILRALEDDNGDPLLSERDIRRVERYIATNADQILAILYEYALLSGLFDEIGSRNTLPYTPVDPFSPGTLEFATQDTAALENAGYTFVYLYRNGGSFGEASATVDVTANGDAQQPGDFRFSQQTITWADGEAGPKAVYFKITDDTIEESGSKYLQLAITTYGGGVSYGANFFVNVQIVDNDGASATSGYAVAENSMLVCEYSWSRNQRDLDTFTTLFNFDGSFDYYPIESVGYTKDEQYRYGDYMGWSGDDQTGNGKEVVVIDTDSALADGVISSQFAVQSQADWYTPAGGSGPAELTVYFIDKITGRTSEKGKLTINPGSYSALFSDSHAETVVGTTYLQVDTSGIIGFELYPPSP